MGRRQPHSIFNPLFLLDSCNVLCKCTPEYTPKMWAFGFGSQVLHHLLFAMILYPADIFEEARPRSADR